MPDQPVSARKKTGVISHTPARRVELSPAGIMEEKVFANELTELINEALGWPAFFEETGDIGRSNQRKTVTLFSHAGKPVVRIARSNGTLVEVTGTQPLMKLIAKATKKYLG